MSEATVKETDRRERSTPALRSNCSRRREYVEGYSEGLEATALTGVSPQETTVPAR
jgi:hypothetical protein